MRIYWIGKLLRNYFFVHELHEFFELIELQAVLKKMLLCNTRTQGINLCNS